MSLTADEKAQIRQAVEAIDEEEPAGVLKGDEAAQTRFWAMDVTVNAPNNQVVRRTEILERMKLSLASDHDGGFASIPIVGLFDIHIGNALGFHNPLLLTFYPHGDSLFEMI